MGGPENEIKRLIGHWFERQLEVAWKQFTAGTQVAALVADIDDPGEQRAQSRHLMSELADQRYDRLSESYHAKDYRDAYPAVREILSELDAPIAEDDRRFTLIAREVVLGEGELANAQVHWAEGQEDHTPAWTPDLPEALFPRPVPVVMPAAAVVAPSPVDAGPKASGVTLSQVFERYTSASHMTAGTKVDFGVSIRRFIEVHGDLDLHHIQKRHVIEFRDAMIRLPRNGGRGLTVPQLLAASDGKDVPRLAPTTINEKSLAALKATLNYALDSDLVRENVAARVAVKVKKNAGPSRLPYDPADLQTIFALPIFTVGDRPVAGGGEAAIWLPILALFTGARLDELGTLTVGDVRERDGVRFLFIKDGKTINARRKIPIHSEVIRLGFLDYVKTRGSRPDTYVFPSVRSDLDEATAPFSKWWGRYARKAIPDTRKVFHSFRHTAKLALRNAGVDKTLRDAIQGHDPGDVAERYGLDEDGEGYSLSVIAEAVEKISYPGLSIAISFPPLRKHANTASSS
ncbi:site-specific integrase [Lichenicola cladoniae]|uniref:Site-specific integrase n=1 Tax=Lichenicola cladoniae TaxID=1484109 RepID=A0A6M8HRA0_9PROT|nr:site-specific integrase [Lichenicola cladoniae]NPD69036.1 site-specific integrase [Acetobacteraceae bacterium]QKE90868.1 site-specific integrase [Lichenicola cladoniae]